MTGEAAALETALAQHQRLGTKLPPDCFTLVEAQEALECALAIEAVSRASSVLEKALQHPNSRKQGFVTPPMKHVQDTIRFVAHLDPLDVEVVALCFFAFECFVWGAGLTVHAGTRCPVF